MRESLNSAG